MKKSIVLVAIALLGFTFSVQAQSCCKGENAKKGKCCAKKATETSSASLETVVGQAVFVSHKEEVHHETKSFTVYGNCGMCQRTIEGALKDVKGVRTANWNGDTDELTVTFNPHILSLDDIKQKVADVGYDSDTHRAKDEVYDDLPGCCQYERPAKQ